MSAGNKLETALQCGEGPAYEILRKDSASQLLFLCDHGGQKIPDSLAGYDWNMARDKHIAFDIGAADMARTLSARFEAPAVLGVYSRLVVDLNRFRHDPTYIPPVSDGVAIPANANLDEETVSRRTDAYFAPYHMAVTQQIDHMLQQHKQVYVVLVHSMTDRMNGTFRPQHAEIMYADDDRMARPLIGELSRDTRFCIGDNEPYQLDETDFTAITHCARRGLPHVQFEVRQDLIGTREDARLWAHRIGDAIDAAGFTNQG